MKKTIFKTVVFAMATVLALSLAACGGSKTPVSGEAFAKAAQDVGFSVDDILGAYSEEDIEQGGITEAYGYTDANWEITYVDHQEARMAGVLFDFYVENAKKLKGNSSAETQVGTTYTLNSNGIYCRIQQVDTTVVAVVCPADDKGQVEELFKAIGY